MHDAFRMVMPQIVRVDAAQSYDADAPKLQWDVKYGPPIPQGANLGLRPVLADLRAVGSIHLVEVTVGAHIGPVAAGTEVSEEKFRELVVDSNALENVYDFARPIFRQLLGLVGIEMKVPTKAPATELHRVSFYDDLLDT